MCILGYTAAYVHAGKHACSCSGMSKLLGTLGVISKSSLFLFGRLVDIVLFLNKVSVLLQ